MYQCATGNHCIATLQFIGRRPQGQFDVGFWAERYCNFRSICQRNMIAVLGSFQSLPINTVRWNAWMGSSSRDGVKYTVKYKYIYFPMAKYKYDKFQIVKLY